MKQNKILIYKVFLSLPETDGCGLDPSVAAAG